MKKQNTLALASLVPLLLAGCASNQQATYVDSKGPRTVVTVDAINIQDFANAADKMVNSLIENYINAGRLKAGNAGTPVVLAISRINNVSGQTFDTDMLMKKIRVALNRTGKVETMMTLGSEDPMAKDMQIESELMGNKKRSLVPDYTISGKILSQGASAGNTQQNAFIFQMSLTSSRGTAVWEEEETIVKQGKIR